MNKKINIGITINTSDPYESIFSNGIRQNIIILRELYEKCENVGRAYIINVSNVNFSEHPKSPLYRYREHIISVAEAKDKCDLIVVCHGALLPEEYEYFHKSGKRIVKQVLGAQQSVFTETVLFKPNESAFNIYKRNKYVKSIWISPHFYESEKYFHKSLYGCEVLEAPYVWDPRFIEEFAQNVKMVTGADCYYKPSGKQQKRLCAFEPNINIVKNCVVPTMIGEFFYRKYPQLLERMSLFNTETIRKKKDFIDFCKDMDSHVNGKLFFENSFVILESLHKHTDIVISHQTGCALNYLYLDAAWFGYPVLHNSQFMKQLGWYYPENNVEIAVNQLHDIVNNFDNNHIDYLKKSRKFAQRYLINNKKNIEDYNLLIEKAMK